MYTTYQLKGLLQLANFRNKFYHIYINEPKIGTEKDDAITLKKSMAAFIEIFCQHHFADSDYTILQKESQGDKTPDQWFKEVGVESILKLITYIIWTDKTIQGYFVKRIKDKTFLKLLIRLESIALAKHKQQKMLTELRGKSTNVKVITTAQQLERVG